jgi:hypothetical protein
MQEASGQKLWLDEAMTHSEGFLTTLVRREGERDLSTAVKNMKHIVASYCYLYQKAQELGFLDEDSDLFFNEKIH